MSDTPSNILGFGMPISLLNNKPATKIAPKRNAHHSAAPEQSLIGKLAHEITDIPDTVKEKLADIGKMLPATIDDISHRIEHYQDVIRDIFHTAPPHTKGNTSSPHAGKNFTRK
jgi:hypothetical protein